MHQLCCRALPGIHRSEELHGVPGGVVLPRGCCVDRNLPGRICMSAWLFDLFGVRSRHLLGGPCSYVLGMLVRFVLCVFGKHRRIALWGGYVLCDQRKCVHGLRSGGLPGQLHVELVHSVRRRELPSNLRVNKMFSMLDRAVSRGER
jgi:hypothetical protein